MGIPFDPKDKKTELAEEVEEEKAEEATEAKEGEGEEGSPKKDHSKIKRDPKEEMPLFLNQVTNLIAAAVPGKGDHTQCIIQLIYMYVFDYMYVCFRFHTNWLDLIRRPCFVIFKLQQSDLQSRVNFLVSS